MKSKKIIELNELYILYFKYIIKEFHKPARKEFIEAIKSIK